MVLRKPNLLDAFQQAAPEGAKSPRAMEGATPAGPFAPAAGALGRPTTLRFPGAPPPSLGRALMRDRTVQLIALAVLLLVGVLLWIGWHSNSNVSAAQTPAAAAENAPGALVRPDASGAGLTSHDLALANENAAMLGSSHDRAFMDPKNKFTLRVAQFANDEAGKKQALAARDYLLGEALPAIQPIQAGKVLLLCVGHEEKISELKKYLDYVQTLRGPNPTAKKLPYADAYVDNIDNVAKRR